MTVTIWYNPKCGTCQKVRAAVEAKGHKPRLVEYLKAPPSVQDIDDACRKAGIEPQQLARQKEPVYASATARCKTRQDWLEALHENPVLIERPMVILEDRAIIARPPERLDELL
jgi:arsenate reductase (glutaredoxin)